MLFTLFKMFKREAKTMAPTKEIVLTVKCNEEFNDMLCHAMGGADMNRSEFMRQGSHIYATLLSICPEFKSVTVERLKKNPNLVRKILVILEEL